nr:pentatricopeptide repeat-containing protein At4g21300 [Ipomoea batatas]
MFQKNLLRFIPRTFFCTAASASTLTSKHVFRLTHTGIEEVLASKLAPILHICTSFSDSSSILQQGQQIHAQIIVNGIVNTGVLGTRILGMYVLCNRFLDAKKLFWQLNLCYASPWNWMIRGFTVMGHFNSALIFYFKMLSFGTWPDKYTFPYVIKACAGLHAVKLAKSVHRWICSLGFELDIFVGSALIKLYAEHHLVDDARCLFNKIPMRDSVLWNVMLNGSLNCEEAVDDVVGLFGQMRGSDTKPNSVTYACVLSLCASKGMVEFGTQLHGLVVKCGLEMDSPVANTLIAMYMKCHCLFDAKKLFDTVEKNDLVPWNGMIGGYVQNGFMADALNLFHEMIATGVKPDGITFASLLPSVSESGNLYLGRSIHGYIVRHDVTLDVFLKNALIDMYFKCRSVEMACKVFDGSLPVDIAICTSMISGFAVNGMNLDALEVFRWLLVKQMKPNALTLASVLPACTELAALKLGKELHGTVFKHGYEGKCFVGSALTDMYAKCGRLDLARQVFLSLSEKDTVCWNSMITGYCKNGEPEQTIDLFRKMGVEGAKYDCVSISGALSACANIPALHHGKEIHGFMIKSAFHNDLFAQSALIDMYAKCGYLHTARRAFDLMKTKNEVSWNSIICAYGNHGLLEECLDLFHGMEEDGFQPDHVTFLAIISTCGHAGEVEEGKRYFNCMVQEYGIVPRMEHYACMIDLYGRAGCFEEAFEVIKSMPITPDAGIWGTLLGACRVHGHVELAEMASKYLFNLDPQNSGYYVLLSNLQADSGEWERASKIRSLMKERGVQKIPGYSWIEVNNTTHIFVAADKDHQQSTHIYFVLDNLLREAQMDGYLPQIYV